MIQTIIEYVASAAVGAVIVFGMVFYVARKLRLW